MKIIFAIVLTLLAAQACPAHGDELPPLPLPGGDGEQTTPQGVYPPVTSMPMRWRDCLPPACALVNPRDVINLGETYERARHQIEELEKQLAELKRAKGCAKLEVTEPPRNFVPKKERDS